jgi:hypothetical protein
MNSSSARFRASGLSIVGCPYIGTLSMRVPPVVTHPDKARAVRAATRKRIEVGELSIAINVLERANDAVEKVCS